jgi:hypothetical protein
MKHTVTTHKLGKEIDHCCCCFANDEEHLRVWNSESEEEEDQ